MTDPYAPPTTDLPAAGTFADRPKVWTPNHVLAATILGGPLGGSIGMAFNARRMGGPGHPALWILGGVVVTVLVVALGAALPDSIPSMPISIGVAMAARQLADKLFDDRIDRERIPTVHWWVPAGGGLACLFILGGCVFGAVVAGNL